MVSEGALHVSPAADAERLGTGDKAPAASPNPEEASPVARHVEWGSTFHENPSRQDPLGPQDGPLTRSQAAALEIKDQATEHHVQSPGP